MAREIFATSNRGLVVDEDQRSGGGTRPAPRALTVPHLVVRGGGVVHRDEAERLHEALGRWLGVRP